MYILTRSLIVITTIFGLFATINIANAQSENYELATVVDGLNQPVGILGHSDGRLFINMRLGTIRVFENGQLLPEAFLDITEFIGEETESIEQGVIGFTFDPAFDENGYFYIAYTTPDYRVELERYTVSDNPSIADESSRVQLLSIQQESAVHNGGHLQFGQDGYLYMSVGDGIRSNWEYTTAYYTDNLLGKILRLDVSQVPYTIPEDNPFVDIPTATSEIWAYGLRNPWRFSFDSETGDMFIGDVGWKTYEEINIIPAGVGGLNFGWRFYEGNNRVEDPIEGIDEDGLVFPSYTYQHIDKVGVLDNAPTGCGIIGGYVYRGELLDDLYGKYIFSDFCVGEVWALAQDGDDWIAEKISETGKQVTSIGIDFQGEIYVTTLIGDLLKLVDSDVHRADASDSDFDLVANATDNCLETPNIDQADNWGRVGVGDVCDTDYYTQLNTGTSVSIYQQHYGAFHVYGCVASNCGFVASIESSELDKKASFSLPSETFNNWKVDVEYDNNSSYIVKIYGAEGQELISNFKIILSDDVMTWQKID